MSVDLPYAPADLGPALVLALVFAAAARRARLGAGGALGAVILSLLAVAIPLGGVTLAGYIRAYTGDLSIVTIFLLADRIPAYGFGRPLLGASSRSAILVWGAVAGVVLYPMALGLGPFDPYTLGFRPISLVLFVVATAVGLWIASLHGASAAILLAIALYHLRPYDSENLWDYLVDPWLCAIGLFVVARAGIQRLNARRA